MFWSISPDGGYGGCIGGGGGHTCMQSGTCDDLRRAHTTRRNHVYHWCSLACMTSGKQRGQYWDFITARMWNSYLGHRVRCRQPLRAALSDPPGSTHRLLTRCHPSRHHGGLPCLPHRVPGHQVGHQQGALTQNRGTPVSASTAPSRSLPQCLIVFARPANGFELVISACFALLCPHNCIGTHPHAPYLCM